MQASAVFVGATFEEILDDLSRYGLWGCMEMSNNHLTTF